MTSVEYGTITVKTVKNLIRKSNYFKEFTKFSLEN